MAHILTSAKEAIKEKLNILNLIIEQMDPESFEPTFSDHKDYKYESIHCGIFNRFAEDVSVYIGSHMLTYISSGIHSTG